MILIVRTFKPLASWGRDRAARDGDHEAPDLIGARGDRARALRSIPDDDALATERGREARPSRSSRRQHLSGQRRRPRPKLGEASTKP